MLKSSETWTTYSAKEKRMKTFHLRCLSRVLGIRWQDKIPNTDELECTGRPFIFTLLSPRRLRMGGARIPKDLLYRGLSEGSRSRGRPRLPCKDTCKRDMKSSVFDIQYWESLAGSTSGEPLYNVEQNKLSQTALTA